MTALPVTLPSPAAGRPLTTVNQIHYALKSGAVYSELSDGRIVQIYQARHRKGVFQVKLEDNRWASSPKRVWAAKGTTTGEPSKQPMEKIHVARSLVGDRSLDDLLAQAFRDPLWLEAPKSDLVVFPQFTRRRLVLKSWRDPDHPLCTVKTFAELAAFLREQEGMSQLLDQDEHAPFRTWQIATPTIELDTAPAEET